MRTSGAARSALFGLATVVMAPACSTGERVFVERLGQDTMAVEVYRRGANRIEGQRLIRNPVTQLVTYSMDLAPSGTVSRLTADFSTPAENPDGPAAYGFTVSLEGDSATIERRGGDSPGTEQIAVPPGTIPTLGATPMSMAVFEQAATQWAISGSDSLGVNLLNPVRSSMSANYVARWGTDSIAMSQFGSPLLGRVEADGTILSRSGERTTMKILDELGTSTDLAVLAADFAARDARGEGVGRASPPGMAELTVDGATIRVDYSRPRKRGREIFGQLVPYNEVWRTGANAATVLRIDRDLMIAETRLPAGEYTLWSTYTPQGGTLIINSQTGQWGTAYDANQDFTHVPMEREMVGEPVEMFTISLEETDEGGVLQIWWDQTRFSVPFRIS